MNDSIVEGLKRRFIDRGGVYLELLSDMEGEVILFDFLEKFSDGGNFVRSVAFFVVSISGILAPLFYVMGYQSLAQILGGFFFYRIGIVCLKCASTFEV